MTEQVWLSKSKRHTVTQARTQAETSLTEPAAADTHPPVPLYAQYAHNPAEAGLAWFLLGHRADIVENLLSSPLGQSLQNSWNQAGSEEVLQTNMKKLIPAVLGTRDVPGGKYWDTHRTTPSDVAFLVGLCFRSELKQRSFTHLPDSYVPHHFAQCYCYLYGFELLLYCSATDVTAWLFGSSHCRAWPGGQAPEN